MPPSNFKHERNSQESEGMSSIFPQTNPGAEAEAGIKTEPGINNLIAGGSSFPCHPQAMNEPGRNPAVIAATSLPPPHQGHPGTPLPSIELTEYGALVAKEKAINKTLPVFLIDIPNKWNHTWNMNSITVRMMLSFKQVNYRTTFLEYPDVNAYFANKKPGPTMRGWNTTNETPACLFHNDLTVMTHRHIAQELEIRFPQPALVLNHEIHVLVRNGVAKIFAILAPDLMVQIRGKLGPRSAVFWEAQRSAQLGGVSLEDYRTKGGDVWARALDPKGPVAQMGALVGYNKEGPFFLGNTPSYADFALVGFLEFMKLLNEEQYQRLVAVDEDLQKVHRACQLWLSRTT